MLDPRLTIMSSLWRCLARSLPKPRGGDSGGKTTAEGTSFCALEQYNNAVHSFGEVRTSPRTSCFYLYFAKMSLAEVENLEYPERVYDIRHFSP